MHGHLDNIVCYGLENKVPMCLIYYKMSISDVSVLLPFDTLPPSLSFAFAFLSNRLNAAFASFTPSWNENALEKSNAAL